MLLKVVDDGEFKDVYIHEGDMFLLPANVPHNPIRVENTVGVVLEKRRPKDEDDRLRWYCAECKAIVYEESFYCVDLGTQLKPVIEKYANNEQLRTCKQCRHVNVAKEIVSIPKQP